MLQKHAENHLKKWKADVCRVLAEGTSRLNLDGTEEFETALRIATNCSRRCSGCQLPTETFLQDDHDCETKKLLKICLLCKAEGEGDINKCTHPLVAYWSGTAEKLPKC